MKKLCLVVAVLMVIAAPVWATVNITCTQVPSTRIVTVSYSYAVAEPNKVRGFALDITVDSGAKIINVDNYPVYPTNYVGKYWVYPGGIVISGGQVTDPNKPVALPTDPGALGGIGTGGITIEMGSLYYPTGDNSPNAPPLAGDLLKFEVDKDCCVTITENAIRGGVVLTNPNLDPVVVAPGIPPTPCFPITSAPPLLLVPNVVGQIKADAKAAIIAAGFTLGNCTLGSRPIQVPGRVISTNPAGGVLAPPGSPVDCVVSKLGDVSGDGKVSAADLVTISTWIVSYGSGKPKSIPSTNPNYVLSGDVNDDNKISAADLVTISTWIVSYGAGKPKSIPCTCP